MTDNPSGNPVSGTFAQNVEESAAYLRFRQAALIVAALDERRRAATEDLFAAQLAWLQSLAPIAKELP